MLDSHTLKMQTTNPSYHIEMLKLTFFVVHLDWDGRREGRVKYNRFSTKLSYF